MPVTTTSASKRAPYHEIRHIAPDALDCEDNSDVSSTISDDEDEALVDDSDVHHLDMFVAHSGAITDKGT